MLALAQHSWNPDWLFGFQEHHLAYGGLGVKEGYANTKEQGMRWQFRDKSKGTRALVFMSRSDMEEMVKTEAVEVYEVLEEMHIHRTHKSHGTHKSTVRA